MIKLPVLKDLVKICAAGVVSMCIVINSLQMTNWKDFYLVWVKAFHWKVEKPTFKIQSLRNVQKKVCLFSKLMHLPAGNS